MKKRVGIIGLNSLKYVSILLDLWNNGICAVLLDWRMPSLAAYVLLKEANVSLCYIDDELRENFKNEDFNDITIIFYKKNNEKMQFLNNDLYDKYKINYSNDEAIILYSSGTTGHSKGIILSHYSLTTNCDMIQEYMNLNSQDSIFIVKPFSHSSTLTGELLISLKYKINCLVCSFILPPRIILNNIIVYSITVICINPTLLKMIIHECMNNQYNFQSLKTIYVSGDILTDKLYDLSHKVLKNINIFNVYGMTETGPRISAQQLTCLKSNSVGKPLSRVSIAIVNENGELVENYSKGIVHVNTPCLFQSYVNGHMKNVSLFNNWYNTGDIGFFDSNSELHIIGRSDDLIIINSHKIYPFEIENLIMRLENVEECGVVKCIKNEQEILVCAYVSPFSNLNLKRILSKYLIAYEIPKIYIKLDKIPKNKNGKIDRKKLIEKINEQEGIFK